MRIYVFALILMLTITTYVNGAKFDIKQSENGFSVSLGPIKIIDHSPENPCLYLGAGQTNFTSTHGNFQIKDYVHLREGARQFEVIHQDDNVEIIFNTNFEDASVKFELFSTEQHDLVVQVGEFGGNIYDRMWLRLVADPEEKVYGGGEQYTYFNLKGHSFDIWTREQGVGRDRKSMLTFLQDTYTQGAGGDYDWSYFPQSSFASTQHYSCHIDGSHFVTMNFENPTFHELFILGKPTAFLFNRADSMESVVSDFVHFMKHKPALPEWVGEGVILGMQGGTERVLSLIDDALDNGVHVSGVWIQDWPGHIFTSFGKRVFWNWEWNQQHYPDLDKHIVSYGERGVNFLAYITPHMNTDGSLYSQVPDKEFLMKRADGSTYLIDFGEFDVATIDLTLPAAVEWYKGIIKKNLIDFGFKGWMADFSEYIPADAVFHNGETGLTMHNKFPVLWAKTNREAVEESGKLGEIFFYMRAGGAGSAEYSVAMWAGDQNVDWSYSDGLPTVIPAALSLGVSGSPVSFFDIGGYTTVVQNLDGFDLRMIRTEELFFRSAELAVFTPVMRTHEGNIPQANYQVYEDSDSLHRFSILVEMFRALSPYTKACMEEITSKGLPLQRPLFLHYEDDKHTYDVTYQYMYGRDLLVAPVIEAGTDSKDVYLPKADTWIHLFTNVQYEGGVTVNVDAPLGYPPVFFRKSSTYTAVFQRVAQIRENNGHSKKHGEL